MAPARRWRAEGGLQEVTVDGETVFECTVNLPLKVIIPCKMSCKPKIEKVRLHIFNKAGKIWEDKYKGAKLTFKILEFQTDATVASVIEKVLSKGKPGSIHPWVVTEVIEAGDGEWMKGTTIAYASSKAAGNLASFGWTGARGKDMPPVWLTVHKA